MTDVDDRKRKARREIRGRLAGLGPVQIAERSRSISNRVLAIPEFIHARTVMIFLPLPTEIDTAPIALGAWQSGKRVAVPRTGDEHQTMIAVEIQSLTHDLTVSRYGVRQPAGGAPVPVQELDFVLVPGLGFDRKGNRLGRGAGFYDRFLSHPEFRGCTCAVAFEEQVCESVPVAVHDRPVRILVTDEHVYRFGRPNPG